MCSISMEIFTWKHFNGSKWNFIVSLDFEKSYLYIPFSIFIVTAKVMKNKNETRQVVFILLR